MHGNNQDNPELFIRRLGQTVVLDLHAAHRSFEREVPLERIVQALESPDARVSLQGNGRIRLEWKDITIILEKRPLSLAVVTVFSNKKG